MQGLAKQLRVSPAFVSQRLRRLLARGRVAREVVRTARGRTVRYRPNPGVVVEWTSPRRGIVHTWSTVGEVDWEYPLTSQIVDLPARESVLAFLRLLNQRKLLPREAPRGGSGPIEQASVVLFGSSARGTARPTSDVDVLVLLAPWEKSLGGKVKDLAAEVSLQQERPIQAFAVEHDIPFSIPPHIVRAVQSEGIVVFDVSEPRRVAEMRTVWELVYMGRSR